MTEQADWLPEMVRLSNYDGDAEKYLDAVFAVFYRDFIMSQPKYEGKWVRCRRDPIVDGKEAGFWHCVSEGPDEATRTLAFERCERIAWIRYVIEHARDRKVDVWSRSKRRDRRCYLWCDESYLVVLGERKRHYQLITAFCTDREHTKRKLRRERDAARNG